MFTGPVDLYGSRGVMIFALNVAYTFTVVHCPILTHIHTIGFANTDAG